MLAPELIQQIKNIQLRSRYLANEALSGEYASAFKGRGMEFEEVREYVPGDEVRTIDWNVTARMQKPYVKVFREERELTLMLLVDVSASLGFGSINRTKIQIASELSALVAYLAIRNNDKVGVILFSDHVEHYIPPKKGRAHVWNIIRQILTYQGRSHGTDIGSALAFLINVQKRRTTCFLVSDFIDTDYHAPLRMACRRHDFTCVHVNDPREFQLVDAGMVLLRDLESGELRTVDTSSRQQRRHYEASRLRATAELQSTVKKLGADIFQVSTERPVVNDLVRYLRSREFAQR